jgi:hypothetical protein
MDRAKDVRPKSEVVLTEHAGGITVQQLKNELEPICVAALCEGSIPETAKALKNSHLLMRYADGIEGVDEETKDAIENLRTHIVQARAVILNNALARNADVEAQVLKLLIAVNYLVDIVSPEDLTDVSMALVRS